LEDLLLLVSCPSGFIGAPQLWPYVGCIGCLVLLYPQMRRSHGGLPTNQRPLSHPSLYVRFRRKRHVAYECGVLNKTRSMWVSNGCVFLLLFFLFQLVHFSYDMKHAMSSITLFISIIMFCVTDNILQNISISGLNMGNNNVSLTKQCYGFE
jgi:hypothetical protein